MRAHGWFAASLIAPALVLTLVTAGTIAALWYRQLPGDQRYSIVDAKVDTIARSIAERLSARQHFETTLWSMVRANLSDDLRQNPGAYVVQSLAQPILLPDDDYARRSVVVEVCDAVPEWTGHSYSPRVGFSVARGYQTFLGSLEPFERKYSTKEDRDRVSQLIELIDSFMNRDSATELGPEARARVDSARADLELTLNRYRQEAERKGYRTTGPAEYMADVWNSGSNFTIIHSGRSIEKKNCIATSDGQSLDQWWKLRDVPEASPSVGTSGKSYSSFDLTGNVLLPENVSTTADASSKSTRIQIRRLKVFRLERPGWFSAEPLRLYGRDGVYRLGALSNPMSDLWGPSGVFNLMPVAIVVVDSPSAYLDLPTGDAEKLVEWISNTRDERLDLGSMRVARSRESITLRVNDSKTAVRNLQARGKAHITAVISVKLPATYGSEPP